MKKRSLLVLWFLGFLASGVFGFLVRWLQSFKDAKMISCLLEDIDPTLPNVHFKCSGRVWSHIQDFKKRINQNCNPTCLRSCSISRDSEPNVCNRTVVCLKRMSAIDPVVQRETHGIMFLVRKQQWADTPPTESRNNFYFPIELDTRNCNGCVR